MHSSDLKGQSRDQLKRCRWHPLDFKAFARQQTLLRKRAQVSVYNSKRTQSPNQMETIALRLPKQMEMNR